MLGKRVPLSVTQLLIESLDAVFIYIDRISYKLHVKTFAHLNDFTVANKIRVLNT